jgi:hypothetical protein
MPGLTPFSTVGPFFKLLVRDRPEGSDCLVSERTRGRRITIEGTLRDGAGAPIDDGPITILTIRAATARTRGSPASAAPQPARPGRSRSRRSSRAQSPDAAGACRRLTSWSA